MRARAVVLVLAVALTSCSNDSGGSATTTSRPGARLERFALTSSAFTESGSIPRVHTCDGENLSPPVEWHGIPESSVELVLTVEDPDAPNGTFVHWLLYGIDPRITSLGRGPTAEGTNGANSFDKRGYGGPCPPKGTQHRYVFILSALSTATNLREGATSAQLRAAMPADAILARGELTGVYGR